MEEKTETRPKAVHNIPEEDQATGQANRCVICLDIVSERAVASPCRHSSFDFLCLVSWLQESPTCPLCKAEVEAVEYGWRSRKDFTVYKVPLNPSKQAFTPAVVPSSHGLRTHTNWRPRRSRPCPSLSSDAALLRRRHIYRHKLYSSHVGTNRLSRFSDLALQSLQQDEELISRARKWIRRELQVFEFLNPDYYTSKKEQEQEQEQEEVIGTRRRKANNAEFLLEYIVAILKSVELKGSGGQAEEMLQEFLGRDNARLFLHELGAWLRSPYVLLEDWDRHVQYGQAQVKISEEEKCNSSTPASRARDSQDRLPSLKRTGSKRSSQRPKQYSSPKRRRVESAHPYFPG